MTIFYLNDLTSLSKAVDKLTQAAQAIQQIRVTPRVDRLGEFIVCTQLFSIFPNASLRYTPQGKCDITIERENLPIIRIEVKTSNYKDEDYGTGWGFALNEKRCNIHGNRANPVRDFCYFNYLVCVILPKTLGKDPTFAMLPRDYLEQHKQEIVNKSKRFPSASHRILLPVTEKDSSLISDFDRVLLQNIEKYNDWKTIT